ncbi:MAG: hypothetical protein CMH83_06670 [Nocardioides sp.]|nr:hypothetical protein [Nocardioides sp.]
MDEKIRALALVRAAITEDGDLTAAILADGVSPELVRHLAAFVGVVAVELLGPEQGVRSVDRLMRLALAQEPQG